MAPAVAAGVSTFDLTTGAPVGGGKVPKFRNVQFGSIVQIPSKNIFLGCCTDVYSNLCVYLILIYLFACRF